MDYTDVDRIITGHGFASERAFKDVTVSIHPIPDLDGCPLGLYYPDSGMIVIPPEGQEPVLLHELGHRYGHYYYNNLSEQYAEDFRRRYHGGPVMMYHGSNFAALPKMGRIFAEGERGAVEVGFERPLHGDDLLLLQSELYAHANSEPVPRIYVNSTPVVRLEFTKGVDWLVVVAGSLAALTVAGVAALAYAVYKTAKDTPWVIPLALFGAIAGTILVAGWAGREVIRGTRVSSTMQAA